MSDLLIRGMEMPKTGRYFVAVDNTDGKDKTVISVMSEFERGDKTRPLLAVHEVVPVPAHGDLVDLSSPFVAQYYDEMKEEWMEKSVTVGDVLHDCMVYGMPPTIIPAEEE